METKSLTKIIYKPKIERNKIVNVQYEYINGLKIRMTMKQSFFNSTLNKNQIWMKNKWFKGRFEIFFFFKHEMSYYNYVYN